MKDFVLKKLQFHYNNPNYLYFLLGMVLMLLAPPIAEIYHGGAIFLNLTYGLILLLSVIYTTSNYQQLMGYGFLAIFLYFLFLINNNERHSIHYIQPLTTLIFFSLVFKNIVNYILKAKEIGLNEIYACISGYLILGVIATPHFYLVEHIYPNAFNIAPHPTFYDFLYYSFITLTTVGFGDIYPIHPLAKSFTMILGIVGQLYLTILVAIIIGKYLAMEVKE